MHIARSMQAALIAIVAVVGALSFAGAAIAAPTLQVLTPSGVVDPAEDLPRTFRFSGTAGPGLALLVTVGAPGRPECSSTFAQDRAAGLGTQWKSYGGHTNIFPDYMATGYFGRELPTGGYSFDQEMTWEESGTFVFCMWEASGISAASTPTRQEVVFRAPAASLQISMDKVVKGQLRANAETVVRVSGATEAPRTFYLSWHEGTAPCSTTAHARVGQGELTTRTMAPGVVSYTSEPWKEEKSAQGKTYTICVWLAETVTDALPVARASFQYKVVVPCIVPNLRGKTVLKAKVALKAANCRVGMVSRIRAAGVAPGRVVKTSVKPGTVLPGAAKVKIFIRR